MKYEISKATAPAMPNLGKGTEIVKLLLTQASKDMYEPLVPMFFPIFGAHIFGAEFQYPDFSWKELTGLMANLVAKSGDNKGQLTTLAKAICRDFSQHDKAEEDKILEWQKQKSGCVLPVSSVEYDQCRLYPERFGARGAWWPHAVLQPS